MKEEDTSYPPLSVYRMFWWIVVNMALIAPFGGYLAVMEEIYPPGTPEILEVVLFMLIFILVIWIPPWLVLPPWFSESRWHGASDFGCATTFLGIAVGGFTGLILILTSEIRNSVQLFSFVMIVLFWSPFWWFSLARSPANYNPRWVFATGTGSAIGAFFALRPHISLEATTATFTEGMLSGAIYSLCYSIVTIVLLKWAVKGGRETTK